MEKMTYVAALEIVLTDATLSAEVKEKLEALKTQLSKKTSASHKPTKVQVANEALKNEIVAQMEPDHAYTVTDLIKEVPAAAELSNQKVSALMKALVADHKVVKTQEKNHSYFTKADEEVA